jgi:hypothetical protein
LPAFLAFAHRCFIKSAILALAAGLIVRFRAGLDAAALAAILLATPARMFANPCALSLLFPFLAGAAFTPLYWAHLLLAAAAIARRPAALIFRRFLGA